MIKKLLIALVILIVLAGLSVAFGFWYILYHYGRDLPDYRQLKKYEPGLVSRLHAADGRLLAEYAEEKRVFVPYDAIPKRVVNAFLAAEDQNFFSHKGVDPISVIRAALTNFQNRMQGANRRPQGASTITQQVAKNFLLTDEVSIDRKIREAILAMRIEMALSKERILELYLNEIFLGFRSYGVGMAAYNYFDKSLEELTIEEAAYLAALPKAPNNYHPVRQHDAAVARRNWVISRMLSDGYITRKEAEQAVNEPLQVISRPAEDTVRAAYFAEDVRRFLVEKYGRDAVYSSGLSVHTTVDPRLQEIGQEQLRKALIVFDRTRGWRGPVQQLATVAEALPQIQFNPLADIGWQLAVVDTVSLDAARIVFADESAGVIDQQAVAWTRSGKPAVRDILNAGMVIYVSPRLDEEGKPTGRYELQQVPEVGGGLVALDPHTGRVLAMVGGFHYNISQFNRVTQAKRQPGSTFKPFVYIAALENGYTPASLVLDAPIVIDQGPGLGLWKPRNYTNKFYGLSTLRLGVEQSRNLMTIRIAQVVGMPKVVDVARRFGVDPNLPPGLASAIGAGETTLLDITTGYAMLVNGGKKITPSFIDRIQDRRGNMLYRHDARECPRCSGVPWSDQPVPQLTDTREQVTDSATAYQMVSILEGVVQRGTGRTIAQVGKPLAGKTGTTNDSRDVWFIGFSPDLAVGIYLGYDEPRKLGEKVTGGGYVAPIFRDFMADALKDKPAIPFRIPPTVKLVRVDSKTGKPVAPDHPNVIYEAFKRNDDAMQPRQIVSPGDMMSPQDSTSPFFPMPDDDSGNSGIGGIY